MTTAIKYGIGFGLATCLWTLAEYALGFQTTRIDIGQVTSYLALVLPLTFLVLAGLAERRRVPTASFARLLGVALLVMLIGDLVSTPFLFAYHHYILPDWFERLSAYERQKMVLAGMAPAEIDRRLAALAMSNSTARQVIGGVIGSTVVGLVIGIPMALLVRRRSGARPAVGESVAA